MSREARRRGRSAGPHLRSGRPDATHSDAHSHVSDAESERSENPNAGALTPRGTASTIEQLATSSARQSEAFLTALQMLARPPPPDPAITRHLEAQTAAQAEATRVQLESRQLKLAKRQQANEARNAQLLKIEEACAARKLALLQQKEERRAAEAGLANARREAAALAAAAANRPTPESAVALATKATNDIRRALR